MSLKEELSEILKVGKDRKRDDEGDLKVGANGAGLVEDRGVMILENGLKKTKLVMIHHKNHMTVFIILL